MVVVVVGGGGGLKLNGGFEKQIKIMQRIEFIHQKMLSPHVDTL